jgi:pyruvate,water dikinase
MDRIGTRLREHDLTFAIVAGVGQTLRTLGLLSSRAIGEGWRGLLNASLQGQGTIISARQVLWLAELANEARREDRARAFFLTDPWTPDGFRSALADTRFLEEFDRFLAEFGHRAIGESDVATPRFSENPDYLLGVIRAHLQATGGKSVEEIQQRQESAREAALRVIRRRMGWRLHYWMAFRWWYRRLCRFLSLREANRHHLMYFSAATRHLALALGEQLSATSVLDTPHDIFFLTAEEIRAIALDPSQDWKRLIARRRAERAEHAAHRVPDTIRDDGPERECAEKGQPPALTGITLSGTPVSAGYVEGPVCALLSPNDFRKVNRGDIIVAPVIDPGMAPVFSLAAGLVVEMGGTLSHGAIIAREYGLPTVVNVPSATKFLKDGDRIAVDAGRGLIRPL